MLHCYYEMYLMKYSLLWNNISYETERIIKILYEYIVKQFNRQCEKQEESIHFLPRIREAVPSISPIKECSRLVCCCSVAKSCPTLCDPMDCSQSGSSVHGIFHEKILEWLAVSFSRGSSQPRHQTWVSCIGRSVLNHWAIREAAVHRLHSCQDKKSRERCTLLSCFTY